MYNELQVSVRDLFNSELEIILDFLNKEGYAIYFAYFYSKKNTVWTKEDQQYINDFDKEYIFKNAEYVYPKNIDFIKKNKLEDLIFLESLANLVLLFLIPKLDGNNCFYYDLILVIKDTYNPKLLVNFSSNLVSLNKIVNYRDLNCNYEFVESFFNLKDNIFREYSLKEWEDKEINKLRQNAEEWPERIAYSKAAREWLKVDTFSSNKEEPENLKKLRIIYYKKWYKMVNHKLEKKLRYQLLCINIYEYDLTWYLDLSKSCKDELGMWSTWLKDELQAYTNFDQLLGAVTEKNGEVVPIEFTNYSFIDLWSYNSENLGLFYITIDKNLKIDEK